MLQSLRRIATSKVAAVILFVPLIISFAVWGIADIFRGSPDTTAFSVGSVQVGVDSFARDYRNAARNAGSVLPPDQAKLLGQQVLENMMLRIALDNIVGKLGLTAGDARVRAQIQANTAFAGPLGTFDHTTFLNRIGRAGYGEDEFVAVSRKDAARSQMLRATEGGYQMPLDYARAVFAYVNEIRAAQYVLVSQSAVGDVAPPSDAVLTAYVKAHPDVFSTPEYRTVSIAAVSADDIAASIAVTEKQIDDELAARPSDYVVPERRDLEQITFASEADAKAAKAALDGGKTFEALAFERKLKDADYKLPDLTKADLSIDPARAEAAFSLALNATSGPVKSSFGYVIIKVTKVTAGSAKSRDTIKQIVQKQLAVAKMADMANVYTDAIGGGESLETAAKKAGMRYIRAAAIDAKGNGPDGAKIAGADNPELLAAIFKAEVGEDGDPFPTTDGTHYFAIKVDGITPPKVKPVEAVRAQAIARWTGEQKLIQLRVKAAALAAKANADHALSDVATSLGAAMQTSPALNRGTNTGLFTAAVVKAIYDAPAGGTIFAPAPAGGFILARVSGIAHPAPPMDDPAYGQGVRQLSGQIASDTTIALGKAVEQHEGTFVSQKLIDQTVGNPGSGS
jgi:peptidyl-prolyl cis-trans isomerase D